MVAQWGFANANLGGAPVAWETPNGNGMMQPRAASVSMERDIDEQVQLIVDAAYDECYRTLSENRNLLDVMTQRLLEAENIDYDELNKMRDTHLANSPEQRAQELPEMGATVAIA